MTTPTDAEIVSLANEMGLGWAAGLGGMGDFLRVYTDAALAKWGQPQAGASGEPDNAFPLTGKVYKRGAEWVLEISGTINDCNFTCRHTQPGHLRPEDVAGLPLLYTAPPPQAVREPQCWCLTCRPIRLDDPHSIRMALCPTCGNKRCPKANDHRNACTNSNDPRQPGSAYPGGITKGGQHGL